MKTIIKLIFFIIICTSVFSQNITNTLGTGGIFTIKDVSNNYLTLTQATGQVNILKTLRLENTTSSTTGIIFKGTDRFMHNYGANNLFLGANSGNFTMTGYQNTGLGTSTLASNISGYDNCALGNGSLNNNTYGHSNTGLGNSTLVYNTYGSDNTATGVASLFNNSYGSDNTSLGYYALVDNTSGNNNTATGSQSLYNNTTGSNNSAFGYNSLYANTEGSNSAFGDYTLYSNSTGSYNTALGHGSLYSNITGNFNSAIGFNSLFYSTGTNNTGIGWDAQVPSSFSSNQVRIGNTSVTYAGIQVAWTITSDRRWKQDIQNSPLGLGFINKLKPVSYSRINDESHKTEYGFIAQDIEEVLKESNIDNAGMITVTDEGMYELRYNDLLAPMIKAIQELKTENDGLKTENDELKERLTKIEMLQNILAVEIEKMKSSDTKVKVVKLGEK